MEKRRKEKNKIVIFAGAVLLTIIAVIATLLITYSQSKKEVYNSENARAMTYDRVQEGDEKVQVKNESGNLVDFDYVQFDAFFLRDLNGDGIAEAIRGTCREIGKEDTLYMELNVLTKGRLEDGVITINSDNFYLQTAIPKDSEISENVIGENIEKIQLNTISSGTQKLLTGIVRSGRYKYNGEINAALGYDTTKYSKINSITLTGTHVEEKEDGTIVETPIQKTVNFNIDWYGNVGARITDTYQSRDIRNAINETDGNLKLDFSINVEETQEKLILKKSIVEAQIPQLNGYSPKEVKILNSNVIFNYDEETRKVTIQKEAIVDEQTGIVKNTIIPNNNYTISVVYPIGAYEELNQDTVQIEVPVTAYYEGYNNNNKEFENPQKSNIVQATIVARYRKPEGKNALFDVDIYSIDTGSVISKRKPLKIYNGMSEAEKDDIYVVRWIAYTGTNQKYSGILMKEKKDGQAQVADQFIKTDSTKESMENVTSNVGIYFIHPENALGEEGWIKVYDDETNELIKTFDKTDWNTYSSINPYKYKVPIKHIRVETSTTNQNVYFDVYNVKELDDEYIIQNYTKEEFEQLQYINSTLVGYADSQYINTDTANAKYKAPYAKASLEINKRTFSTQETEENMVIDITAEGIERMNEEKWQNGIFLIKLPKDIINLEIKDVQISNGTKILSYEQYEENGEHFIKINTENKEPIQYVGITIDCKMTPSPTATTKTDTIQLYAYNELAMSYMNNEKDIYDINGNQNKEEMVEKVTKSIDLISPNSLLTSQNITEYGVEGKATLAPNIAEITREQRTANVNIEINNNYSSTISEIKLLGRVPFEGNKYTINKNDMNSTFTATMKNTGIQLPESLKGIVKIYYSENGEATQDIQNPLNGWTLEPSDFSKVKSYLIDFGNHNLTRGEKYTFTYTMEIPENVRNEQVAYGHHAVYFSLDTENGKYYTQTEPNKVGIMPVKKYDLELTKYHLNREKLIQGATYFITEKGQEAGRTKVTDENGKITLNELHVNKIYTIKEIKTPEDYKLNEDIVEFSVTDEEQDLKVNLLNGNVKSIKLENEVVKVEVEDEVKARLKIMKTQKGEQTPIRGVRFKITGSNLPSTGKTLTTNINGEVTLKSLDMGRKYTLEEVRAEGYYLLQPIEFKIEDNNEVYNVNILSGEVLSTEVTQEDYIPTANIRIENSKIPTYNLIINKVKKGENIPLQGAKFRLYKGTQKVAEYITDEQGKIEISNLYQYETERNIDQTYTLKEVVAPEGYSALKDITFKVENLEGVLTMDVIQGKIREQVANGNTLTITLEDTPSFKLIKKDEQTQELLPNTKFAIYNVDNGVEELAKDSKNNIIGEKEIIDGKEYYTLTTNENGEFTATLKQGLYKVVEVKASDDKYDITENVYYFGIGESQEGQKGAQTEYQAIVDTYISSIIATSDGGYIIRSKGNINKI